MHYSLVNKQKELQNIFKPLKHQKIIISTMLNGDH